MNQGLRSFIPCINAVMLNTNGNSILKGTFKLRKYKNRLTYNIDCDRSKLSPKIPPPSKTPYLYIEQCLTNLQLKCQTLS